MPTLELEFERKDGSDRAGEAIVHLDGVERQLSAVYATKRDGLFAAFLRQSPVYLYVKLVTPTESRVLLASENFGELTGIPSREMLGKAMPELFPPDVAAQLTADDWEVVSSRQARKLVEELNGRTFSTSKFPLVVGDEVLLGGCTVDITEQRQAEEARRVLERQLMLAKRRESLCLMASGVAHQLNNLLATVKGNLELARAEASPAVDALLAEADEAIRQAASVGGSLLTYVGRPPYERRPRHLGRQLAAMLSHLRAAAPENVRLTVEVGGNVPACTMDASDLQRLVVILATNGWEATAAKGGTVRITARRVETLPADAEPNTARSEAGWACLEVSDDGAGMDGETRERMFEPFFTTKLTGRGLSLPAAQGIVRASGGAFAVESAVGHGTTVRVYLPACTTAEQAAAPWPSTAPTPYPPEGVRALSGAVLVVDDDPAVMRANRRMLQRLGHEVLAVASGGAAVALFAEKGAAIGSVLLDLSMPGMDGWQVLTALRRQRPELFVVVASGYDLTALRREFRDDQPDGWLQKPFPIADLAALFGSPQAQPSAG